MNKSEQYIISLFPDISDQQLLEFDKYYQLVLEWSKVMNLTAILDKEEVYVKHFYDSLLLMKVVDFKNESILDLGSGAGFPGIPLKIMNPSIDLTLLEPTLKRVHFLEKVKESLQFQKIEVIAKRAEDFVKETRAKYDIVTSRAVASLPILLELSLPFLKIGGVLLAMKGSSYIEELDKSDSALDELGGKVEKVLTFDLPKQFGKRSIIVIRKTKETNEKYPRSFSKIKKKSL